MIQTDTGHRPAARGAGRAGEGRPPRRRGRGPRGGRRLDDDDAAQARPVTPVTPVTPVIADVLSDDTNGGSGTARGLTVSGVAAPADGTAAVQGGTVAHTPNSGSSGCDSFAHAVTSSRGQSSTAAVLVLTFAK
ncbi:Ig-like domain-containing protein [Streptomyces yunnanensis]|uniref:Ig-like domain-containing protein n=1 Tax=Streptomyces yunnanensis TaxID=156453 RepID=A0ABY8A807_9ACTN|nr:Ig-like domain-containing protein [Streptomyces yunnanensis]WEB40993.1 Ig-like domain-containing protein [Streptomyces yunnanensis]